MTSETSPHMTKAPTRSTKTHVRALQKGSPSMSDPTRRAHQLIVAAGVALEELLDTTPAQTPAFDDMTISEQVIHAAHALVALHEMDAPTILWNLDVDDTDIRLGGNLHEGIHPLPTGIDQRSAMHMWANLVDGSLTETVAASSGDTHVYVRGTHLGVPVRLYTIIDTPTPAVAVAGEVAA